MLLLLLLLLHSFWEFFMLALAGGLSLEFDWQQVSGTLLSILADLNNAIVRMVSTCPLISKSFNHFTNPLGIVPSAPIIYGITVTFMFHKFFSSQTRSTYSSLFLLYFSFTDGIIITIIVIIIVIIIIVIIIIVIIIVIIIITIIIIIVIIYSLRVFDISFSWWSFTGTWMTASLLESPGLFSVFWPSSIVP